MTDWFPNGDYPNCTVNLVNINDLLLKDRVIAKQRDEPEGFAVRHMNNEWFRRESWFQKCTDFDGTPQQKEDATGAAICVYREFVPFTECATSVYFPNGTFPVCSNSQMADQFTKEPFSLMQLSQRCKLFHGHWDWSSRTCGLMNETQAPTLRAPTEAPSPWYTEPDETDSTTSKVFFYVVIPFLVLCFSTCIVLCVRNYRKKNQVSAAPPDEEVSNSSDQTNPAFDQAEQQKLVQFQF